VTPCGTCCWDSRQSHADDGDNRPVDFSQAMIIMTGNLGAAEINITGVGKGHVAERETHLKNRAAHGLAMGRGLSAACLEPLIFPQGT